MLTIIGLDLSLTQTGYCILQDDEIIDKGVIKINRIKGMERLALIKKEIMLFIMRYELDVVVLEGYSMGSRFGKAFSIGELGGIIKLMLFNKEIKTILVPPTTLKKFVTGKGNAPKDMMMMKALSKYNIEFTNNNECDAYCLAKLGEAYLNGTRIKYEKEAIQKVEVLT
jgi:crossover junction endodeoxyribonuclease RuvC